MKLRSKLISSPKISVTRSKKLITSNVLGVRKKPLLKKAVNANRKSDRACIEQQNEQIEETKTKAPLVLVNTKANQNVENSAMPRRSARTFNKVTNQNIEVMPTKTLTRQENQLIEKIALKRSGGYRIREVVLVKWPYYPYWPAVIDNISKNKVTVKFFGDNERTAVVIENRIYDFVENLHYIIKTLKTEKWKAYKLSILEAEEHVGVPSHLSLFNRLGD